MLNAHASNFTDKNKQFGLLLMLLVDEKRLGEVQTIETRKVMPLTNLILLVTPESFTKLHI